MRQKLSIAAVVVGSVVAFVVLVGAALWFYPPVDSANASGGTVSEQAGDLAAAARFRQRGIDDPRAALASCERAQATAFAGLAAHLVGKRNSFADARVAVQDGRGLTYLSADVLGATGSVKAVAPVWVYGGAGYAGLSPSADRASVRLPDAGAQYGARGGDAAAVRV
ncbi:MAG: hypothetical protein L0I76_16450, partial [Pseudonocardia sp.]|nr:hypothetical protein [Pseudonocardia sp.]